MTTDPGLARYLDGRNQRARSEASQIIAEARKVAYLMVQEAASEEARVIEEMRSEIKDLQMTRTGLRRSIARLRRTEKELLTGMRQAAKKKADTYRDRLMEKAKAETEMIRADAHRAHAKAIEDGARLAGMTVGELDEARKREGRERLRAAAEEAYTYDFARRKLTA